MKTAMKFVKKQVIVEAIQFNGNSNKGDIELFVGKELKAELESETAYVAGQGAPIFSLLIETKEGVMKAFKNDWIIKEPFPTGDRDFYPCKPDIFGKTYLPYASHPSPMSAEPTVQQLRDAAKNNPDTFLAGALYVIDNYKLNSHPMSAEQVEYNGLTPDEEDERNSLLLRQQTRTRWFTDEEFKRLSELTDKLFANSGSPLDASTTPSVKAEGWVSAWQKICIGNNVISVG